VLQETDLRGEAMDYLYQRGVKQQYAFSARGGGSAYRYALALGYDQNRANVIGNSDKRLSINLQNSFTVTPTLELNAGIWHSSRNAQQNGLNYNDVGLGTHGDIYDRLMDENGRP